MGKVFKLPNLILSDSEEKIRRFFHVKNIKNYEGLYAVTEKGEVWSYKNKRFLLP